MASPPPTPGNVARAVAMTPAQNYNVVTPATADIAGAPGPRQQVVRPVKIGDSALAGKPL